MFEESLPLSAAAVWSNRKRGLSHMEFVMEGVIG